MRKVKRNYTRELKRTADRLHKEEAENLLQLLAAYFNVPVPSLRWSFRGTCGRAYYEKWAISSGPLAWRGVTNSLLHEFAHLLNYKRNRKEANSHPHGKEFIAVLHEVTEAWYGDSRKYGWGTEYITVMAAGPRKDSKA